MRFNPKDRNNFFEVYYYIKKNLVVTPKKIDPINPKPINPIEKNLMVIPKKIEPINPKPINPIEITEPKNKEEAFKEIVKLMKNKKWCGEKTRIGITTGYRDWHGHIRGSYGWNGYHWRYGGDWTHYDDCGT